MKKSFGEIHELLEQLGGNNENITKVAAKTNLLSLNASIEAARVDHLVDGRIQCRELTVRLRYHLADLLVLPCHLLILGFHLKRDLAGALPTTAAKTRSRSCRR